MTVQSTGSKVGKTTAFWDASALVPLCIQEKTTSRAQSHFRKFAPVVWWGSGVEIYSAVCRLHREKLISDDAKYRAVSRLQFLNTGWREILPGDEVRALALDSLEKYSLRAADSLQLAAGLVWCGQRPAGRNFVCGDERLASAADSAGFAVLELG